MILKTIILGIVQGLTEFLPISSSGHLALLERYFGIAEPMVLAVFLHFGTLLATIMFFYKHIIDLVKGLVHRKKESMLYALYIVVGSVPIVIFAVLLRSHIESSFANPGIVALMLGVTGAVVLLTNVVKKGNNAVGLVTALIIGLGQMCAAFPGISRSGMTISAGIFSKVKPENAFTFSFLLSLPAVLGANLFELFSISSVEHVPSMVIGVLCSFLSGLVALKILKSLVQRWFYVFGIYCVVLSLIILIIT